ncbi:MAG: hypothetical protein JNN15_09975 [Blastocatellia bacterium]|nr:hypothetical protein [Blastocatellia bacterium]
MRNSVSSWQELNEDEQQAIAQVVETDPQNYFLTSLDQHGRDTLLNIYYSMRSDLVAGDLWQYVHKLRWAGRNQIGVEVEQVEQVKELLETSKNFQADTSLTLLFKKALWSFRQILVEDQPIHTYGLQLYRPDTPTDPYLLVVDIDVKVFSNLLSFPRHALDILLPDKKLNEPLNARQELIKRNIFPT